MGKKWKILTVPRGKNIIFEKNGVCLFPTVWIDFETIFFFSSHWPDNVKRNNDRCSGEGANYPVYQRTYQGGRGGG